jgi:osmotically-inducible protein OsmY
MKLRTFVLGGAAAAAVTYLFDPQMGKTRRAKLRDQLGARAREAREEAERKQRHAGNLAQGAVSTLRSRADEIRERASQATGGATGVATAPLVDDTVIEERVRAEALGRPDVPKDRIVVNVEDGVVVLRGELDSRGQIDEVLERVGAVRGVMGIDNLLHVRGTPPPNKRDAMNASDVAERNVQTTGRAIE